MASKPELRWAFLGATLTLLGLAGCDGGNGISLSLTENLEEVPVPAEDGPRLGSIANVTPIRSRPEHTAELLGYLHAGAKVARASEPYSYKECKDGWYPVRPRGFICASGGATTDMEHPTLTAMAIQPNMEQDLPYTYGRTRKQTTLFEVDADREQGVRAAGSMPGRSGIAIVGSWKATDEEGAERSLAMMTDGRFVATDDLEAATPSDFEGFELGDAVKLPVAFVVKRGIHAWSIENGTPAKQEDLSYHSALRLTGKFRQIGGLKFWALEDGRFVRHKDVSAVVERSQFPSFATPGRKWIDISVIVGSAVLYEGQKPVFATLVSVGRDRMGDPENSDATARGEFPVVFKHLTLAHADAATFATNVDMYDVPWALELESGQLLHGAYWHDRFGIEHGPGNVQLSPRDARRVWHWAQTELPKNWHGTARDGAETPVIVNIRK